MAVIGGVASSDVVGRVPKDVQKGGMDMLAANVAIACLGQLKELDTGILDRIVDFISPTVRERARIQDVFMPPLGHQMTKLLVGTHSISRLTCHRSSDSVML
jgi:hypothetical protein